MSTCTKKVYIYIYQCYFIIIYFSILVSPIRDCAIIIWRGGGGSKINRGGGGAELKPKRRLREVRCNFLNICRGGGGVRSYTERSDLNPWTQDNVYFM